MPGVRRRGAARQLGLPPAGTSVGTTLGAGLAVTTARLAAASEKISGAASQFVVPAVSSFAQTFSFADGDEIDVDMPGPGIWEFWLLAGAAVDATGSVPDLPDYVPVQLQGSVVSAGGTSWFTPNQIMVRAASGGDPAGGGGVAVTGYTGSGSITASCGSVWDDTSVPGLPTYPGATWTGVLRGVWVRPE